MMPDGRVVLERAEGGTSEGEVSVGKRRVEVGVGLRAALTLGLLGATVGCQLPLGGERDVGAPALRGECVSLSSIGGYRVLDNRTILVDAGPRQMVIEVYADCEGLRFAEDLGLEGRGDQICDYRTDKLIVRGQRCTIASIREYDVNPDIIQQHRLELNEEIF